MNGNQIAVASSGRTDSQNQNREVDLDMFPTELFSRLDVNKTPLASMLEGGVAGTVNMRSARPFDHPGRSITYSFQGGYNSNAKEWSPRGSLIGSQTWSPRWAEFASWRASPARGTRSAASRPSADQRQHQLGRARLLPPAITCGGPTATPTAAAATIPQTVPPAPAAAWWRAQ